MSAINLKGFSGEQPRIIPRLMPQMAAQSAINTRLDDGGLTPMRDSAQITTIAGVASPKTIYRNGAEWLAWGSEVNAAPGPVADDRLYYTGDGVPKMRVGGTIYPLAVPRPVSALTATPSGSGAGDIVSRVYVYTWVTAYGEESEPSPASAAINWQPGQTVNLSGFAAPPAGRNITKQRIYRSQTGSSGTTLYFIDERAAANTNYADTIAPEAFGEPLPSIDWNTPPDGLEGLIALPNGMMAAFVGRDLYFCEPWRPHAWPEKYVQTTNFNIVGIGASGGVLFVMTEGQPYLLTGATPDAMQMQKIERNYPCINSRGIVDLGYAVAYPSHEGLVTLGADGSVAVATANIFSRDAWLSLSPATIVGAQFGGRYVLFYDTTAADGARMAGAALIDLTGASFLIRSDATARCAFYDLMNSALYYIETGKLDVMQFDAPGAQRLHQYWKSKEFVLPNPDNFGVIRIDTKDQLSGQEEADAAAKNAAIIAANNALIAAGPVGGEIAGAPLGIYTVAGDALAPLVNVDVLEINVSIFADGKLVQNVTRPNRIERLPGGFKATVWEVAVFGNVQVEQIRLAKTVDELKAVS